TGVPWVYASIGEYNVSFRYNLSIGDKWLLESVDIGTTSWLQVKGKTKTGQWDSKTLDFHTLANAEGHAKYDIQVLRQEPLSSDFKIANKIILNSVVEIVNGDFVYPNTALLGLKIKATGQLSGSPPNITTLVKGLKINVPDHSGSAPFRDLYWSEDNNRWEYNGAAESWDESTYVSEYSNNAMLCLKDFMINKRYGLGEYINDADLSNADIVSIIKECHKEYTPTEGDYLSWWDAGIPSEFVKHIGDPWGGIYPNTITVNSGANTIAYASAYSHHIPLILDAPLKSGQKYQLSLSLSGTSHNVDVDIGLRRLKWGASNKGFWYQIGNYLAPELSDKGNGTHTYDFVAPFSGINRILLLIKKNGGPANCGGTITDVSLSKIQGTGSNRAWHYHTYNGVFDAPQAAQSALLEFTNAFRVWPAWYDGAFKFIMDKDETPIHTLSISNTVSFTQSWVPLSEIPYKLIGQFTDEDHNYDMTQIMIKSTDDTLAKSNETTLGLKGITNRKRAERELKFRLSKFSNSTHSVVIRCGMDMLHATAGDIINVSNDVPQWGHGTRVASYNFSNKYIYLTEPYTVTDATPADVMIKYQDSNNTFQTATINMTGVSDGDVLRRITTKSWPASPLKDGVAAIGLSTSYVKKFRLLSVARTGEEEVEVNALEHIDTLYSSEPVLTISQDHENQELNAVVGRPNVPQNISITVLEAFEGIGFEIHAEHADLRSNEIIVQFSTTSDNYFETIGSIPQGQSSFKYVNNNLEMNTTYRFRFIAKGLTGNSTSIYHDVYLPKIVFKVNPVLSQTWDGLDVTIQWNPVGQNLYKNGLMDYYTIWVYHTSYDPNDVESNLLRRAYKKGTEYRYTYEMNIEDSGNTTP
ncbi:MAG: phage tail protein, partial [Candidatus Hodarchaeales archaeon]